jgi:CheY-like chemotaxis protein/two-component sensor histidine kinase
VARIDAGVLQPNLEDLELQAVFDGLVASHRGVAQEKELSLRALPTPLLLRSDRVLLECVLGNLLSNAIKFTRTGGVILSASLEAERVLLTVSDTGVGIPAESQEFIFGEFNRLYDADSRQEGLGLGLSNVRRMVGLLGGVVSVVSVTDGGSTFTIRLPYVAGTPLAPRTDATAFMLRGVDLLLVDDDAEVLSAMAGELTDLGAAVRTARTGAEALALARSGPAPAAILSDLRLPDMDGIALLRALREQFGHRVRALLISGSTELASLRLLASGDDPWLAKPAAPAEVVRALTALLAEPQASS